MKIYIDHIPLNISDNKMTVYEPNRLSVYWFNVSEYIILYEPSDTEWEIG